VNTALADVRAAIGQWPDLAREAGVPEAKARQVQADFRPV
jgi:hypothetical protein